MNLQITGGGLEGSKPILRTYFIEAPKERDGEKDGAPQNNLIALHCSQERSPDSLALH